MKIKSIIYLLLILVSGFLTYYLFSASSKLYSLIPLILAIIFIILLITSFKEKKDSYELELKKILRTYDSILIEVEALPKVTGKKIVRTKYFKDLVNVQFELRKPIYYFQTALYCEFLVTDDTQAYIFTLKREEEYVSKSEEVIEGKKQDVVIESHEQEKEEEKKFLLNEDDRKDMIYNMVENDESKKDVIINDEEKSDDIDEMEEFKRKMHIK